MPVSDPQNEDTNEDKEEEHKHHSTVSVQQTGDVPHHYPHGRQQCLVCVCVEGVYSYTVLTIPTCNMIAGMGVW